jgi:hypothetical protein
LIVKKDRETEEQRAKWLAETSKKIKDLEKEN